MKVLLQRVSAASVSVAAEVIADIQTGLLLFVGFRHGDGERELEPMAAKVANLRIFPDAQGRFNHSVLDVRGAALVVPQFTLYADTRRGRRPDFTSALAPEAADGLFQAFVRAVAGTGVERVEAGRFGADMQVRLVNDGPVTIMLGE